MFVHKSVILCHFNNMVFISGSQEETMGSLGKSCADMKDFIKRNEKKINTISKVIVGIFLIPFVFGNDRSCCNGPSPT